MTAGIGRAISTSLIMLVFGLTLGNAAAPTTSTRVVLVHTQGLGTILTGVRETDEATSRAVCQRLAALRAKYPQAVFVDGGDAIGPMVFRETQYGLPTYRILDQNRYAAAALSARDGLHTSSFYRLVPGTAEVRTPLVGTFTHALKPTENKEFKFIEAGWAAAECGLAAFQVFGVATSMSLTGVLDPLPLLKSPGSVENQARYILDHLDPKRIPIVLSDLSPQENDSLARLLNRNAVVFEGGYPWRLINPPAGQGRNRTVGPVLIVSHFSPGEADVVELPRDLRCANATAHGEGIWKPQPPAWKEKKRGLFSRKPLEARLVDSWFTDTFYLPSIGLTIGTPKLLKEILIPFDNQEDPECRTPPLGARDWQPPRWMEDSRHLRDNEIIYRYNLSFHGNSMGHVYRLKHIFVPGGTLVDMLVAVDEEHRLRKWHVFFPPMIGFNPRHVTTEPLFKRLAGKRIDEIELDDWPERAGAEFVVDNLVRDIQILLAWDEEAD